MNRPELEELDIRVDSESRIPKYRQIVNSIVEDIKRGALTVGQRIPSINEISEEFYLSRDTVEKAYALLKEKKIIVSARGKGYYVSRTDLSSQANVLFLLNKLSPFKLQIFNSFVTAMGGQAQVDLSVYHGDARILLNALHENTGRYDHYVLVPHFCENVPRQSDVCQEVIEALRRIPEDKLLIIDNYLPDLQRNVAAVYQDFRMDIYEALQEGIQNLKAYRKLYLVFPRKTVYPFFQDIVRGFRKFCSDYNFESEVKDSVGEETSLNEGDAYVVIEESDLVSLIKIMRHRELTPGKEVGVISYNDSPLKDLLGITVITTDFQAMGETAAYMILRKKKDVVKNVFSLIKRRSL
ncbi:MAG TPA: GntR family transcriptional regulator [Cyclobacteriaceae bacterium]|nr:GntR family transcriptional regulator [Cyclobacteriaceae bacterium]